MIDISGKWALVTGASRGVGKEIAVALNALGCNLVLHSRSAVHTEALAKKLSTKEVSAVSLAADLSEADQVNRMLSDLDGITPQIDILYNNAAIMMPYHEDVYHIPSEAFRKSFEINVISQIKLCNALIPAMIERGWGRVINLTTDMDKQPQFAPYATSKAALRKFTQDFVPILDGTGVTMNALHPGWLRTDMGSDQAEHSVDTVIPGALVPALLSKFICGKEFLAQDYVGLSIERAVERAELEQ